MAWLTCDSRDHLGHFFEPHMRNEHNLQNIPLQFRITKMFVFKGRLGGFFLHLSRQPVLFFTPPMGNFFSFQCCNDCCILSSYLAFQGRTWLCFFSSLVSIEGFYQFTWKLSLLGLSKPISSSFYSQGKVLQTPEHPGGLPWTHKFISIFPALGSAKLDALSPAFLSSFLQKLDTGSFLRLRNGNREHVIGLTTKSCSRSLSVCDCTLFLLLSHSHPSTRKLYLGGPLHCDMV